MGNKEPLSEHIAKAAGDGINTHEDIMNAWLRDRQTADDIAKVLEKFPQLTSQGYESSDALHFQANRRRLLASGVMFRCVCEWLKWIDKETPEWLLEFETTCKDVDGNELVEVATEYTSSYLKHVYENDVCCVDNGIFIAAAIHMGFDYEIDEYDKTVGIYVSEDSINRIYLREPDNPIEAHMSRDISNFYKWVKRRYVELGSPDRSLKAYDDDPYADCVTDIVRDSDFPRHIEDKNALLKYLRNYRIMGSNGACDAAIDAFKSVYMHYQNETD